MVYKKNKLYLPKFLGNFSVLPILLIGLFLRLININASVLGVHSWRQADTASIARNFISNNLVIWEPQVDWSGSTQGYVECEFPLYQYLVAHLYKIFGVNEIFARGLSVIFGCLSIFVLYRLIIKVFDVQIAWWGALFYAILPTSVFYSRTIQPESLMIFLGIFSLERWLAFTENNDKRNLIISWLAFTFAVLIKVLPLFWIGIPILISAIQKSLVFKYKLYIYPLLTIVICIFWYYYSYKLGQSTGLTFGLWGSDTDRYSWLTLLDVRFYIDLFLRIIFRNFLLLGLPLIYLSIKFIERNNIFLIGIYSVLFTGLINPVSFGIHEYYQLPIMIFSCPLMGLGFVRLNSIFGKRKTFINLFISLIFIGSLLMLKIDYWDKENPNSQPVWDTAQLIRNYTNKSDLIISVTGGDPTLLYLSNRKGWLISPNNINRKILLEWKEEGAKYIAGSWEIIESYNKFSDKKLRSNIYQLICNSDNSLGSTINGCNKNDKSYLLKFS